jgi:hypothetical protein
MALTVRPDDEVYQFDTVWLGPDEYTLPIQARYVAWGTWLACFLVTAALLIPIGGHGPGGVLGSLMWAIAISVVAARAVMLIVDHERPLRSLPQLFSAEARAALAASRSGERSLLLHAGKVRIREVPEKVLRRREREREAARRRTERRAERRSAHGRGRARLDAMTSAAVPTYPPPARSGPVWSGTVVPPDWEGPDLPHQQWTPGQPPPVPYPHPGYQPGYPPGQHPGGPTAADVDGRILLPARRVR